MEKRITTEATVANLETLRDFVGQTCQECGGEAEACSDLELAADEAATNVVLHGYKDLPPGPIELIVACEGDEVAVTIVDQGRAFSPEKVPPPDLTSPWQERSVGGLGWHFIREMMDAVEYHPGTERGNRLVLRKRVRPAA